MLAKCRQRVHAIDFEQNTDTGVDLRMLMRARCILLRPGNSLHCKLDSVAAHRLAAHDENCSYR